MGAFRTNRLCLCSLRVTNPRPRVALYGRDVCVTVTRRVTMPTNLSGAAGGGSAGRLGDVPVTGNLVLHLVRVDTTQGKPPRTRTGQAEDEVPRLLPLRRDLLISVKVWSLRASRPRALASPVLVVGSAVLVTPGGWSGPWFVTLLTQSVPSHSHISSSLSTRCP